MSSSDIMALYSQTPSNSQPTSGINHSFVSSQSSPFGFASNDSSGGWPSGPTTTAAAAAPFGGGLTNFKNSVSTHTAPTVAANAFEDLFATASAQFARPAAPTNGAAPKNAAPAAAQQDLESLFM